MTLDAVEPRRRLEPDVGPDGILLRVVDLEKVFNSTRGMAKEATVTRAVADVSLTIRRGETFGVVGESGSGKSTLARCILRLIEPTSGDVWFGGVSLRGLSRGDMRQMRQHMQIVFQDPFASLDPRMTARDIVGEALVIHKVGSRSERLARASDMLGLVGLHGEQHELRPYQFSGGQRQRIAIARALVLHPTFVALDEPVTALDASIQGQVLNLLRDLQRKLGLTYLFIVHDLVVAQYFCDRLAVMYAGTIVEYGTRDAIFERPLHPYTSLLLESTPQVGSTGRRVRTEMPVLSDAGAIGGCPFVTRCPVGSGRAVCQSTRPALKEYARGQQAACHFPGELSQVTKLTTRGEGL